jgi:hypothetical protein
VLGDEIGDARGHGAHGIEVELEWRNPRIGHATTVARPRPHVNDVPLSSAAQSIRAERLYRIDPGGATRGDVRGDRADHDQ